MYPVIRFLNALRVSRHMPPLGPLEPHVSTLRCWPWDIDPWLELNNGRTLTLYDLGRVGMAQRSGLSGAMREHGYGMTVAGSSVRYRIRVRAFDKLTMVSRVLGWDARFLYIEQSMWKGESCTSQILLRCAVVKAGVKGMVSPQSLVDLIAPGLQTPALSPWVAAWVAAEAERPWPPESAAFLPR